MSDRLQLSIRVLVVGCLAAGASLVSLPAQADAVINVHHDVDETEENGFCSLREAIVNANNDAQTHADCLAGSGFDKIEVPSGYFTPQVGAPYPAFTDSDGLHIDGVFYSQSMLTHGYREATGLHVDEGPVTLEDIGITGAREYGVAVDQGEQLDLIEGHINDTEWGPAIQNNGGTVTIDESNFSGNGPTANNASGEKGGTIASTGGWLTITDTSMHGGSADGGGGIYVGGGTATIARTLIVYSHAKAGNGGGVLVDPGATVSMENVTLTANTANAAGGEGGGIENAGNLSLNNVTITDNNAAASGGGISGEPGATSDTAIANSIIYGNTTTSAVAPECSESDAFDSLGHNLGSESECGFDETSDVQADPKLLDYAQNGHYILSTHGLALDSPAIDAGSPLASGEGACAEVDQRSFPRPVDGPDADTTPRCDIGAYEALTASVDDATVKEGDAPNKKWMNFELAVTEPVPTDIRVEVELNHVTTEDGDIAGCRSGGSNVNCDGYFTIPEGSAAATFTVKVAGDNIVEPDEDLTVLFEPDGLLMEDGDATGTILDDDEPAPHPREITLKLRRHLRAKGRVTAPEGPTPCYVDVPVKIQKKRAGGGWKTLGTALTNDLGYFGLPIDDKQGKYRAIAPQRVRNIAGTVHTCMRAESPTKKHEHNTGGGLPSTG